MIKKEFQIKLENYQKTYTRIVKRQCVNLRYLWNTLYSNKNGLKQFKGLIHNYIKYYKNNYLKSYIDNIDERAKTEASMKLQFEYVLKRLGSDEREGPVFTYMHVQDFHLPSVFHSVEDTDWRNLNEEFLDAFELLKGLEKDSDYKGNILADLSARYCDKKVEQLFYKLKDLYKDNFMFIVTADHGYPSFEYPPRPMIYNQTYTEAFHVPFIMYDGEGTAKELKGIKSCMDIYDIICQGNDNNKRKYVLSEYGGPGCPDIANKPIWYTYIDEKYRISLEAKLNENISYNSIKFIYDTKNDKKELYNIRSKMKNSNDVEKILQIVQNRHLILRKKFENDKLIEYCIELAQNS